MSENLHDIDKLFLDSIEGHEEAPPGKVWDDIDHQLDKKNIAHSKRKYNKLKLFSAALLLLLMSVIVYQLVNRQPEAAGTANGITVKRSAAPGVHENTPATAAEKNNTKTPATAEKLYSTTEPAAETMTEKEGAAGSQNQPSTVAAAIAMDSINAEKISTENKSITATAAANKATATIKTTNSNAGTQAAGAATVSKKEIAAKNVVNNGASTINTGKPARLHALIPSRQYTPAFNAIWKKQYAHNYKPNMRFTAGSTGWVQKQPHTVKTTAGSEENTNAATAGTNWQEHTIEKNNVVAAPVKITRPLNGVQLADYTSWEALKQPAGDINSNATPGIALQPGAAKIAITKKSPAFHFSVMPFFSRQFSFDRIVQDQDHGRPFQQGPNDRDRIKNDETYTASSSWGLLVELPLRKKWSVQAGFSYNTRSVTMQPKQIYAQMDNDGKVKYRFDCSSGYTFLSPKTGTTPAVGDSITVAASKNSLQYIGVPLTLTYTFLGAKKLNIIPSAGVMANFLVKQRIETSLDQGASSQKENITSIQGLRKTYFNAMAGIALQYTISKRISLNIIPAANIALSSINNAAAVKSYPNSFSITGGVKIHF